MNLFWRKKKSVRMGKSQKIFIYTACTPQRYLKAPRSWLWWSLKSQLNPHLAQLGISSLYILRLMENSAAVCDNYQPAAEDRAARKGEDGWRWRGEPEKKREIEVRGRWAHEESWEKELLLTRLSSGDTILSPFSWLPPLWRLGRFFLVCHPLLLLLHKTAILGERH